jgi:hypothetical protein
VRLLLVTVGIGPLGAKPKSGQSPCNHKLCWPLKSPATPLPASSPSCWDLFEHLYTFSRAFYREAVDHISSTDVRDAAVQRADTASHRAHTRGSVRHRLSRQTHSPNRSLDFTRTAPCRRASNGLTFASRPAPCATSIARTTTSTGHAGNRSARPRIKVAY